MIKIAMWQKIETFGTKEEAIARLSEMWRYSDSKFESKVLERALEELEAGNERIVFQNHCEIPEGFFDGKKETIKILVLGEVFEFKTKEEAVAKLEERIEFFRTYGFFRDEELDKCAFNIELVRLGGTRMVDYRSPIPEKFYD